MTTPGSLGVVEADFDAFVGSRYDRLRRAAYVLTGDVHAADDLVQTTMVKLLRHWSRVAAADDPDAYLFRKMTHTYRSGMRRRWHREHPHADMPTGVNTGRAESATDAVTERHAVVAALKTLSPAHREVLVLRFMADWSEARTAVELGCSVGTVKSRTSRALAALRGAGLRDPLSADQKELCP